MKESFSILFEKEDEERFKSQIPDYKVLGKIDVDEVDQKKKRKRLNAAEIMANTVKISEDPKIETNNSLRKHFTENFNCKFNIYFKEEHVKQRMDERGVTEDEIINLVKVAIKPMVYFSFKYKFHILKGDSNNVNNNSFMIRHLHNNSNDLQIPVNVLYKSYNEYDIIVHTVINYDPVKMWDGQYVINIHSDEQPDLLIKRNGSLIPVE
jgi:hypothetical protein